jgi:gamma-glutamylcyclotransferase
MLYFAYGSNLDETQMRARCPGARLGLRAVLKNHTLVFGGHSSRWGGAVASVQRAHGAEVEGLLYRLNDQDLDRLDHFEGCPWSYERVARQVVAEDGRRRLVQVYQQPDRDFVPRSPASPYLKVIERAYHRLGFDRTALERAINNAPPEAAPAPEVFPRLVFVYGSLLEGQSNHRWLSRARKVGQACTQAAFDFFSLGAFPGLVAGGHTAVEGEVYEVDAITLAALDRLEGHPSFYRRTRIELDDGSVVETYLLTPRQVEGCLPIHSGSWRRYREGHFRP